MGKRLPKLKSDKQVEELLQQDLSGYLSAENLTPLTFEFAPKSKVVNLRMSTDLFEAVKIASSRQGIPYQKYIRQVLESALRGGG